MVVPEHVRGIIYIEAFKQTHVKEAIAGNQSGIFSSSQMSIVVLLNEFLVLNVSWNKINFYPGITNLRLSTYYQQMVPIKEMTDVLRVVKERIGLKPRQWVRLKRGIYKDDLAQVDYVDMAQNQVHLKVQRS